MNRIHLGLLLCALSACFNIDGVISLFESDGPPAGVGIGSIVVALATFAGVLLAWNERPGGTALTVASRVISAVLFSAPAFFLGAPGWVYATAACGIALTIAGLGVLWTSRRVATA